ncbi:protein S100-A1 [Xyrichtys novacula]|uniref:Protein S100 n=1 Tax=Xyrichtys novacula TaxID=13765 RepID=A0AAV1HNK0_XYRNO|nr:protein S100-A1 [Xyrichtys novacula]
MMEMVVAFETHAQTDGDPETLSKMELKELIQAEMPGFLEECPGSTQDIQGKVDTLMNKLDQDGDGKMDFMEFIDFLAGLTLAIYSHVGPCRKIK